MDLWDNMLNVIYSVMTRVIKLLFSLVPLFVLARVYSKNTMGEYLYVLFLLSTYLQVCSLNAKSPFIQKTILYGNGFISRFFSFFLLSRVLIFLIFFLMLAIENFLFLNKYVIYISFFLCLLVLFEPVEWLEEKNGNFRLLFNITFINGMFFLCFKMGVIYYLKSNADILILLFSLEQLVYYFLLLMFSKQSFCSVFKINARYLAYFIKSIYPFFLSLIMVLLYSRIDQYMLKEMIGTASLADFVMGKKLTDNFIILPMALASVVYPVLLVNRNKNTILDDLKGVYFLFVLLGLFFSIVGALIIPTLTGNLFGVDYYGLNYLIYINCLASAINCIAIFNGLLLTIFDKNHLIPIRSFLGALLNITLNLVLIPKYGAVGASISTCITIFITGYIVYVFHDYSGQISYINRTGLLSIRHTLSLNLWKKNQ